MKKAILVKEDGEANTVWVKSDVEAGNFGTFELVEPYDELMAYGEILEVME